MDERKATQLRWDLWNLRSLIPTASPADLDRLQTESRRLDRLQERVLSNPEAARRRYAPVAQEFLAANPDLHRGLLLSLHLGPYSLAPVPWLLAGHDVRVLVNRQSHAEIAPIYAEIQQQLKLPGRIDWTPIEGKTFAVSLARTLRRDGLVLVYIDGNDGYGGLAGTLTDGVCFALPGRSIRVRTGLARLALRLGCPVHGLLTCWDENDDLRWQRGPTWRWPSVTDPVDATHEIYTWGFAQILRWPEQWRCWSILPNVYDSFGRAVASDSTDRTFGSPGSSTATGSDAAGTTTILPGPVDPERIRWLKPAVLWPGNLLEDQQESCFYDALGMTAQQLAALESAPPPTVAQLAQRFGEDFVQCQVARLRALGFLAPAPES